MCDLYVHVHGSPQKKKFKSAEKCQPKSDPGRHLSALNTSELSLKQEFSMNLKFVWIKCEDCVTFKTALKSVSTGVFSIFISSKH